jgi:hypothetical protein
LLIACLAYSSTLKMEKIHPSETSVNFHRSILRHVPEDSIFNKPTVQLKTTVFWIVTPCILVDIYELTGETYCLLLHGSQHTKEALSSENLVKKLPD